MLDTNICIFTIENRPQKVRDALRRDAGPLRISSVTLMELIYGADKSAIPERNLPVVEGFAVRLDVLDYGQTAAKDTGQFRAELARSGFPIGPFEQLIAGHARSRGLILVTNNRRVFEHTPGLRIEDWATQVP